MKILFIVNPVSGTRSRRRHVLPTIESFIKKGSSRSRISITEHSGHARVLAMAARGEGFQLLVAAGGDGTINEVATAARATNLPLAIIPCGSGDGLARHLGIPRRIEDALALITSGREMAIDAGSANGKLFVNVMGIGFDAELARRFNALQRRGLAAYAWTGTIGYLRYRPDTYHLANGSHHASTRAMMIAVANASQYGNNAFIAPSASVNDGKLDLVCLPPTPLHRLPSTAIGVFGKSLEKLSKVIHWQGDHFTIQRSAPGIIHTDGEVHATVADVTVQVLPKAIRVIVPQERNSLKP